MALLALHRKGDTMCLTLQESHGVLERMHETASGKRQTDGAARAQRRSRNVVKGYDESEDGEPPMQLNVPPTLIDKRLSSGGYTNAEEVLRRALEAQDAEESWTDQERRALSAHIEEGYLQAERGELIDGAQARREIQAMKDDWRLSKK
jgi:Arc/MetJ-type ribon-helix-helix transcriptional regulator